MKFQRVHLLFLATVPSALEMYSLDQAGRVKPIKWYVLGITVNLHKERSCMCTEENGNSAAFTGNQPKNRRLKKEKLKKKLTAVERLDLSTGRLQICSYSSWRFS